MDRLFAVRNSKRDIISPFFSNKKDAKTLRDDNDKEGLGSWVTLGPDHWRYTSKVKPPQPKRRKNRK